MENLVGLFRLGVNFIFVLGSFHTVLTDSSFLHVFLISSHIHQIPIHVFITPIPRANKKEIEEE